MDCLWETIAPPWEPGFPWADNLGHHRGMNCCSCERSLERCASCGEMAACPWCGCSCGAFDLQRDRDLDRQIRQLSGDDFWDLLVRWFRLRYREGTVVEVRDVPRAAAEKVHTEYHGVTLLDAQGVVVALPTSEQVAPPAEVLEQAFGIEIDRRAELEAVEKEIAEFEEKIAGLRARAAEIKGATCDHAA
jgi:hypothetical protein